MLRDADTLICEARAGSRGEPHAAGYVHRLGRRPCGAARSVALRRTATSPGASCAGATAPSATACACSAPQGRSQATPSPAICRMPTMPTTKAASSPSSCGHARLSGRLRGAGHQRHASGHDRPHDGQGDRATAVWASAAPWSAGRSARKAASSFRHRPSTTESGRPLRARHLHLDLAEGVR